MNLNDVLSAVEAKRPTKRRGRGEGSGLGKTSGRGNKGAKSRSGWRRRYGYEGGQMPLSRRVPKRGFNNFNFGTFFDVVNVGVLGGFFEDGATVDRQVLIDRGILKPRFELLKLLGDGEVQKKLAVVVHAASGQARKKIEAAGGTLNCLLPPRKVRKPRPLPGKPGPGKGKEGKEAGPAEEAKGKPEKPKKPKGDGAPKAKGPEGGGKGPADSKGGPPKGGKKGEAKS